MSAPGNATRFKRLHDVARYFPVTRWLPEYEAEQFSADLTAGIVVTVILIPQALAYAMLAGLPAQVGLYSCILPLILYAILGSARAVSLAPAAIDSMFVATTIGALAAANSPHHITLAIALALMTGFFHILMRLFRLGDLADFISMPVLAGFTNSVALMIMMSQLRHILGIPGDHYFGLIDIIRNISIHLAEINPVSVLLGIGSILLLLFFKIHLPRLLVRFNWPGTISILLTKSAPLLVILLGSLLTWRFSLDDVYAVAVVGIIPSGLPHIAFPEINYDIIRTLYPAALTLAFISFVETISIGRTLSGKISKDVDPNQELLALGVSNVASALSGGFSVAGGFSRSATNFAAGARTGISSLITALLVTLIILFMTPLLHFIPVVALAAIIIVAVTALIDFKYLHDIWTFNRTDAASFLITFFAVLIMGIQTGIIVGILSAIVLYLRRTSRPHIAVVGQLGHTGSYRNILRYETRTCNHVLAVRIDESLYFANAAYLSAQLKGQVAASPEVKTLVLIGSGINSIDASALDALRHTEQELLKKKVTMKFAEFKGPVMDRLKKVGFDSGPEKRFYMTVHEAMKDLGCA